MKLDPSPDPSSQKPARRRYLVDRQFQLKYTLLLVLGGVIISLLFGTIACVVQADIQHHLAREVTQLGSRALDRSAVEGLLNESLNTLLVLTGGAAVFMAIALALLGILVTHRVAGPIQVMSNYVEALAHGRYPLVRPLRKKDELKPFFEQLQVALDSWRRREEDDAQAIQDALSKLKPSDSNLEAQTAFAALTALCERKRGMISN